MSERAEKPHIGRRVLPSRLIGDEALAARVSGGDEAAFEELFRRYHQPIYRYCAAMVGSEEGKDMLQNVMTKAMTSMPDNEDLHLKPWLYRVARNECVDQVRRSGRVTSGLDADAQADAVGIAGPERAVEERERIAQLVEDLSDLPERQRSALVMRELSGLGYADIAAGVGGSEEGAKQLVYEARLALQQQDLGRRLDCVEVRKLISARDRRRLRGRTVRAHLRACEPCRELERDIKRRKAGLRSLCPPLPMGVAAGLFEAARQGAAGTAGGVATAGVAGSGVIGAAGSGMVAKGVVAVVIAGGIGAGVGEVAKRHDGQRSQDEVISRRIDRPPSNPGWDGSGPVPVRGAAQTKPPGAAPARPGDGRSAPDRPAQEADRGSGAAPGGGATPAAEPVTETSDATERIVPGHGVGSGPAQHPAASSGGQARAAEASGTVPGQTGAAPPSQKPAAPPGQVKKAESGGSDAGGNGKSPKK